MADKYEVTMMYRVVCPEGTEAALMQEFGDDDNVAPDEVLTELISEAQHHHVDQIASHTGVSKNDFVYLRSCIETWSAGWYLATKLPNGYGQYTLDELRHQMENNPPYMNFIRCLVTGVETNLMSWIWEGEN